MSRHRASGGGRHIVIDANAADATVLKSRGDDFFGLANGTVALDSPDIANTIESGVHSRTRRWSDREETREQRVVREGIL